MTRAISSFQSGLAVSLALLLAACSPAQMGRAVLATDTTHGMTYGSGASPSITEPAASASTSSGTQGGGVPTTTYVTPPPSQASIDGWVASFSNGVKFLGWTVTGDTVAGTYSETFLAPAATTLSTDTSSFNGTVSGTSVTLTFSHGFGSTISGELVGNTLRLSIPQTDGSIQVEVFRPGTSADYNTGVQVVQSSVAQRQSEAASVAASAAPVASQQAAASSASSQIAQAQSDIDQAAQYLQSVMSDLSASTADLGHALDPLADSLVTQASDLKTVQLQASKVFTEAKANGRGDANVCGDGATARGEEGTVRGDADAVTGNVDGYKGARGAVQSELRRLRQAAADLAAAQSARTSYISSSTPSDASVATGVDAANAAMASGDKQTSDALVTADAATNLDLS